MGNNEQTCIFCDIINGKIPSKILYNCDDFIIIEDINPQAPKHFLAIPKEHFAFLAHCTDTQSTVLGKILQTIPQLKQVLQIDDFRIIINQGKSAGQTVFHLHFHILGGKEFGNF
ncbi:MAG: HIT domain-containing protein [Clostridiales bacterium]|jgi:histidine triad (HIT) family protein|nr:HIT domain-containing protein [Clostridiales bacterium]